MSADPEFGLEAADIVGCISNPPGIECGESFDTGPAGGAGLAAVQAERSITLFAALDIATVQVQADNYKWRHRRENM